jgi:hypothetical protein
MSKKKQAESGVNLGTADPEAALELGNNQPSKPTESKAERFTRLAPARVSKALYSMRRLIPLGNRTNYEYTEEHTAKILKALADAYEDVKAAYSGQQFKQQEFMF